MPCDLTPSLLDDPRSKEILELIAKMALTLQQTLRDLCCNTGWCYAVLWKLQPSNHIVLTWEDGHCGHAKSLSNSSIASIQVSENGTTPSSQVGGTPLQQQIKVDDATGLEDHIKLAVAKISDDIYSLGEEIGSLIGHIALTGKHQWIHTPEKANNSAKGTTDNGINLEQIPDEWSQFNVGIKTIAVVAVRQGVVELGSTQKMIEDINFVSHIRALFDSLQSASAAFPLDFSTKKQVLRSHQGNARAVPVSKPMPLCRGAFTALNGPQKQGMLCNNSCNNGHFVDGPNLVMIELSNKQASPNLHPSDFALVDEVVSSPRNFTHTFSTEGNANSKSLSTLTSLSGASCGPPSETFYKYKSFSEMDEHFKEALMSPSESVPHIWDCLCLEEAEFWHKNFSPDSSRFKFPEDTTIAITKSSRLHLGDSGDNILKIFSGCNCSHGPGTKMLHDRAGCLLKGSCWHMKKSSPWHFEGKKKVVSRDTCTLPTTQGERIDMYANSTEQFKGSSWSNEPESLQRFETMSKLYAFTNIKTESLLGAAVENVSNVAENFQLHPNMLNDSTSQGLASKSECVVSTQSILSVNSSTSDNFSTTIVKQPKSKALQSACNHNEFLGKCKIKTVGAENFRDPDLKQSLEESHIKLEDGTCIEKMHILKFEEPPPTQCQATISSRKRSRPTEASRPKDRQLIRDRLRKLRKIVPNSTRCSIDELLERTIKHVHYLQRVTQHD